MKRFYNVIVLMRHYFLFSKHFAFKEICGNNILVMHRSMLEGL